MKFNNPLYENEELTYEDVFIFQEYFEWKSRITDTDINPNDNLRTHIPLISANMNAVTGKRMAETLARYGWLGVLPQDMEIEKMLEIVNFIKSRNINFDTPLTVKKSNNVRDALGIINKRAHKCVIMVDENEKPLSIFTPSDLEKYEQFTILGNINKNFLVTANENISPEEAYNKMLEKWISALPIVDNSEKLIGIITKKDAVRRWLYNPTLDKNGKLNLAIALWANSFVEKAVILIKAWVNIFVLDTAHGYQKTMIDAVKSFRKEFWNEIVLIAWNVSTAEATRALIEAWANWVKVWIWPGAMCTTRMMTWVGRPQFSAVYHCSNEARKLGWFVIADGWVKEPRDLALAMAAWARYVMLGTILSGTFESTGDIHYDGDWFMYKQNYGMASGKAVALRNDRLSPFERAKKSLFQEWISTSKIYLRDGYKSVGDIVDKFTTWLRSSMTYVWAKTLEDFNKKARIWVQTQSGYMEWTPHGKIKK